MSFGLVCYAIEMMHAAVARYGEDVYYLLVTVVASDMILIDLVWCLEQAR